MKKLSGKFRILFIIVTVLYISGMIAIVIDSYPLLEGEADAAIVFGNKVHENGAPSKRLKARLDACLVLLEMKKVNKVIVSGGLGKEGHDEAVVMAHYLYEKGIDRSLIIIDSLGFNTHKTSQNAMKILGKDLSVVAVSQQYHISRSKLSLHNAGFIKVYGYFPKYYELRDLYAYFRGVPAWIFYWMRNR